MCDRLACQMSPTATTTARLKHPKAMSRQFLACTRAEPVRLSQICRAAWYGVAGSGVVEYRTLARLNLIPYSSPRSDGLAPEPPRSPDLTACATVETPRSTCCRLCNRCAQPGVESQPSSAPLAAGFAHCLNASPTDSAPARPTPARPAPIARAPEAPEAAALSA